MSRLSVPAWVPRPARYIAKLPKPLQTVLSLSTLTTAMGALVIALVIWRVDVVKLMPQTADFYKLVGLEVNLRGLAIKDVKIGSEIVDGKPVLVIEGVIVDEAKKAIELPRLRFVVRDGREPKSTLGIRCWSSPRCDPAKRPGSAPASPRPRQKRGRSTCGSSPGATSPPEEPDVARILIADDEESMRLLVSRAIALDGHEIVTAEDGGEALDILIREQGAFDLLLTDIKMPIMDGIALALAAARDFPDLTILLMTGFADQRERASGLNAIIHDVVTKPFSVADIRTAVADALASRA